MQENFEDLGILEYLFKKKITNEEDYLIAKENLLNKLENKFERSDKKC